MDFCNFLLFILFFSKYANQSIGANKLHLKSQKANQVIVSEAPQIYCAVVRDITRMRYIAQLICFY